MYIPSSFLETDIEVLTDFISKHPIGLFVTSGSSGLLVSPLPFNYCIDGEILTLVAHLARANNHWKDVVDLKECLVIFQGSESYVTPSWYPSKATTHKVVPTWNYEMVQVKGIPKVKNDIAWLKEQVSNLTNKMEGERSNPWKVSDAPEDFINIQLKAIIGLEIEVSEIKGKWKMSQNRYSKDALGVVAGLSDSSDPHFNQDVAQSVLSRIKD